MRASLISPEDPIWSRILEETPHDFYHLPAYTKLAAGEERGEAQALLVEAGSARLLLPLVVRSIPGSDLDATSAYGHPGPLVTGAADGEYVSDALAAGVDYLRESGFVSLFVRLHPILNTRITQSVGALVRHGETVAIDLSLSAEELVAQTRRNHRQQIRQAREAGYVVREDREWTRLQEFKSVYRATMERLGASDYYLFDDRYFDSFRAALGDSAHLAVVEHDGRVAAAMLFVETAGIVVTHLSGSDERDNRHQPTKLLYDFVRWWAKDRGNQWVQLGGGLGAADDSLLHFKSGFSQLRFPYRTLRVIVRQDEYARLSEAGGGDAPTGPIEDARAEYFPAYRRPIPVGVLLQPGPGG